MDYLNALTIITNFILIPGLTYGSQLALGAMGVTLIYAVLRFSNFAHGEIMSFDRVIANPPFSLKKWGKEKWGTKSGKNSTQGKKATGERYLPKKARESLSDKEYGRKMYEKAEELAEEGLDFTYLAQSIVSIFRLKVIFVSMLSILKSVIRR